MSFFSVCDLSLIQPLNNVQGLTSASQSLLDLGTIYIKLEITEVTINDEKFETSINIDGDYQTATHAIYVY